MVQPCWVICTIESVSNSEVDEIKNCGTEVHTLNAVPLRTVIDSNEEH